VKKVGTTGRDMATRPSPMTSANMAKAARKSSRAGVNPSDSASADSCAKVGIGSKLAVSNTTKKPNTGNVTLTPIFIIIYA